MSHTTQYVNRYYRRYVGYGRIKEMQWNERQLNGIEQPFKLIYIYDISSNKVYKYHWLPAGKIK